MRPLRTAAALLVTICLGLTACVNQGFDDDPALSTPTQSAPDAVPTGDRPGAVESSDGPTGDPADDSDGTAVAPLADAAALASLEEVACTFDEPLPLPRRPDCYEISVPEDWSDPDPADRVVVPVAVFAADPDRAGDGDATIYLDGGPGASTLDLLWSTFPQIHRAQIGERDYIAFDQRGVGRSEPQLACPELVEVQLESLAAQFDNPEAEASANLAALTGCRDRLVDAGVDLQAYNSLASANDIEAIRGLLGYRQLNLLGVSYGTRLAQTYLRQYPGSVRSAVLDSIVPTEADLWTNLAGEAVGAFEQLFEGCAADPACAAAYPDLETRFFALLDTLDRFPVEVTLVDPLQGTSVDAVLDGDDLMGLVFQALYSRSWFSVVPQMVAEVEVGNYAIVEALGSNRLANLAYGADGMQISVECNEEVVFESEEAMAAATPTADGYRRLASVNGPASVFELCRVWPAGRAPAVEDQLVTSDVPTLLLAGGYDPITRPGNADVVARGLTNHRSYLLADEGHGIVATPCGASLVADFIDDPAAAPDDGCVATSPEPVWVGGPGTDSVELVEFSLDEPFQIGGLRPDGWLDVGAGVFARQRTAIDPTSLIVQPTGGIVPDFLVELLSQQLGVTLVPDQPVIAGAREWQTFRSDEDPDQAVRLAASTGPGGALVVLVAPEDEIDGLVGQVLTPALEAVSVG